MKKFILLSFTLVFIAACNKETTDDSLSNSTEFNSLKSGKAKKIEICHYSEDDDNWYVISISENAWPAHEMHGDVRLDDQDGDSFVPNNECGYGNMGDEDDNDDSIYPGSPGSNPDIVITNIRLGGQTQTGDSYIGPTCTGTGLYKTTFYVTGAGLPANKNDYLIKINNVIYNIAFFNILSENEIVIGFMGLPSGEVGIDIVIQVQTEYTFGFPDVYDAPICN